ncbi:hypothetical protein A6D96_03350 [Vibrio cyclitrophicus]|nr:serine protease [Vibrio cyclitrophicus]OBT29238.1 hypothetical protein A9263_04045 [Vibrio cyclitrophicus]OCH56950.1 hypothetical protein A6D96_03350 [Vibrio cyclitrophicus]
MAQQHGGGCVMLVKKTSDDGVEFLGSGFLCHEKGYILTCAHTLNLTDKLGVLPGQNVEDFNQMTLDRVNVFDAQVAQFDSENDVALIKLNNPPPITVPNGLIGNEQGVKVGSSVGYLGYPFGQSGLHTLKVSQTIISSKVISDGTKQFQLDAMIHEGNSGGPLIDLSSNKVIGIISGRFSPTGNGGTVRIGNHALGTDSTISFATIITYGIELMKSEGLHV